MLLVAVIIAPDKSFLIRNLLGIYVNNIKTEVKLLRNIYLEILLKILVTVKINSVYKSV